MKNEQTIVRVLDMLGYAIGEMACALQSPMGTNSFKIVKKQLEDAQMLVWRMQPDLSVTKNSKKSRRGR